MCRDPDSSVAAVAGVLALGSAAFVSDLQENILTSWTPGISLPLNLPTPRWGGRLKNVQFSRQFMTFPGLLNC